MTLASTVEAAAKLAAVAHVEALTGQGGGTATGSGEMAERIIRAETERAVAEMERLKAQAENVGRETERLRAEAIKVWKEAERAVAETERLEAEAMMVRSKKMMIDAETERLKAETEWKRTETGVVVGMNADGLVDNTLPGRSGVAESGFGGVVGEVEGEQMNVQAENVGVEVGDSAQMQGGERPKTGSCRTRRREEVLARMKAEVQPGMKMEEVHARLRAEVQVKLKAEADR
ncbi:uncharacterized protein LAJ45_10298 [Morchella importuna]|uniref:uncharacterized protein n=1 Tax=Morchella importuna TaxID=1174673 RepID=UPI001E8DA0D7|nr:uncharacterized protein LAJ45_10298 [Morchella importuna]KAH8145658.1 hypothetical protein LAJ45_10298 [Morchella importuna]